MLNLDTHILVHALNGTLRPAEDKLVRAHNWGISDIVLWELAWLVAGDRLSLDLDGADFQRALSQIHVWPIDLAVARKSAALDFRSDPADHIIAATSIVHRVPLLTRDTKIKRSSIVPLA